jgi:hypothetical protein
VPRGRLVVGRYAAPGPLLPGRVRGLRVTRHCRRFSIQFGGATNAARYLVRVTGSDGRHLLNLLGPRGHSFALPVLGYSNQLTVTVAGVSPQSRQGPVARASAR